MRAGLTPLAMALLLGVVAAPAVAQPSSLPLGAEHRLPDAAQEARAHGVFRQIRCVVCQNESIDDSEAPIAGDLRRIVRAQVADGRSDADIRRFLVDRYGEFVLLKPRFDAANALLWLAPFALLFAGLAGALLARRRVTAETPLSADEQGRLEALRSPE